MRVSVFAGLSTGRDPSYAAAAIEVGAVLAESRHGIVYGGGNVGYEDRRRGLTSIHLGPQAERIVSEDLGRPSALLVLSRSTPRLLRLSLL